MSFRRGVGISFLVHTGILLWVHLQGAGGPQSVQPEIEPRDDFRRVALQRVIPSTGSQKSGEAAESSGSGNDSSSEEAAKDDSGGKQATERVSKEESDPKPEPPEREKTPPEKVADADEDQPETKPAATKPAEQPPAPSESQAEDESNSGGQKVAAAETDVEEGPSRGGTPGTGTGKSGDDGAGQQGSGSGEGEGGVGDGGGDGGGEGIDRAKLLRGYASSIYEVIARYRSYPTAARRAKLEGTVQLEIKIDASGRILSIRVHESSGHKILDEAALEVLESVDTLPSPPKALAWQTKRLRIPIRYELSGRG